MRLHCFLLLIAQLTQHDLLPAEFSPDEKGIKLKTFPQDYVISLCGVVVRCSCVKPKVPGSSPIPLFFPFLLFFPFFCVVVFYKYIHK